MSKFPIMISAEAPGQLNEADINRIRDQIEKAIEGTSIDGAGIVVVGNGVHLNLHFAPAHITTDKS